MALKLEHTCSRCGKSVTTEVQDVKAAQASEELDAKRATVLKDIQDFFEAINPDLLPDLVVVRRSAPMIAHSFLCNDAEAKRSCEKRVDDLVSECEKLDPRKPRTKKAKPEETATPSK